MRKNQRPSDPCGDERRKSPGRAKFWHPLAGFGPRLRRAFRVSLALGLEIGRDRARAANEIACNTQ